MIYPTNWLIKARRKYLYEARQILMQTEKNRGSNPIFEARSHKIDRENRLILSDEDAGPDEFSMDAIFGQ